MKKKFIRVLMTIVIVIGGCISIMMTAKEVYACKKCNTKPLSRKCGECGSSRLFAKKEWIASNNRLRTLWACDSCKHSFITELRSGKEVVLIEKEHQKD